MKLQSILAALGALILAGCDYDAPITEKPSAKIDERLLGTWLQKGEKPQLLRIRKYSDMEYVLDYDGLFRAFFSEIGGKRFVNVQTLEPAKSSERKYAFVTYELKDEHTLVVHTVNKNVLPDSLHTSGEIAAALERELKNPRLLDEEPAVFIR
ncbi:MAG: hypothetical protein QOD99_2075 [Chthoniobacter sp.]|jgi:hypothetical protein|nr:hypothetical protein [Chthoniobacter sp.]